MSEALETISAAQALRASIHARLTADATLVTLMGGAKVFDEVPRNAKTPYLVMGDMEAREAGDTFVRAEEHRLTLTVWSDAGGLSEALTIAARVADVLDHAALALEGHALVSLAWLATDARRVADGRYRLASLRFRALTEPEDPLPWPPRKAAIFS